MAQALFMTLHARDPAAQIDVVAPGWSMGILARMPEVRNGLNFPLGHGEFNWSKRREFGKSLQPNAYNRAIVLPRSWKSALVPWFADIPLRTGFRGEFRYGLLNDVRILDKKLLDQTVKRFVALGIVPGEEMPSIPNPRLTHDADNQERLRNELGLTSSAPAVAMMPGAAYGPAKMWPLEYYGELAAKLTGNGMQVWVIGSESERPLGESICQHGGAGVTNLCGQTELADTPDLFAMTVATITNDSGLMHVAAAAGSHVIALYGSSSPDFTPPLTERKTIRYQELGCSPCFKRECPLIHLDCLRSIDPASVYADVTSVTAGEH
jgi:heptosyltransferase-2